MRILIAAVIACLTLSVLVACGSDPQSESEAHRADADKPRSFTTSGQSPPRSCPQDFVESRVRDFLTAANSGRAARLKCVVASDGLIFSHGLEYGRQQPRRFFSTASRDELVRHLLKRRNLGDRMSLLRVAISGFDRSLGICNFGFAILRSISGGPPRPFIGKGAIYKESGRVVVWNTGGEGKI